MKDKLKKMAFAVVGYLVVKNIVDPASEGYRQKVENKLRAKNLRKKNYNDFQIINFYDLNN